MLDISFIRENRDRVERAIRDKGVSLDLPSLIALDDRRKEQVSKLDALNHDRRENAGAIKKAGGKPDPKVIAVGRRIKEMAAQVEGELRSLEEELRRVLLTVPNVYSEDTPIGSDDSGNVEIKKSGTSTPFDFEPKDHVTLATDLDLIDFERGAKVHGFRGYFLKNEAVELQWALLSYCLSLMKKRGFQLMIPPTMVREMALTGSGHFPDQKEEIYPVGDMYLAGTSEPALLAYRADEILELGELPLKYCGVSPCYRREVGSYGKDTKGVFRVHEFWKVEQVVITSADLAESLALFEEMLGIAEEILQSLELPYRVVQMCTGDMGVGKYKMYDIETWMPSRSAYAETHSCSHLTDWQARRLNMRYRDPSSTMVVPYTMNNTVIASPRILIALMENYQRKDGSIAIPDVLQPYFGGATVIARRSV